jgi:hypothetical protein
LVFAGLVDVLDPLIGQLDPVPVGKILDGRNRYQACVAAGEDAWIENWTGKDPIAYVLSLNMSRRHLDESQRAMVAAKLATLKQGANQHSKGTTIVEASKALNVSDESILRAKTVQRQGTPLSRLKTILPRRAAVAATRGRGHNRSVTLTYMGTLHADPRSHRGRPTYPPRQVMARQAMRG